MNERVRSLARNHYPHGGALAGIPPRNPEIPYMGYMARLWPGPRHHQAAQNPTQSETSSGSFSETIGSLATIRVLGETVVSEVAFSEHSLYIHDNSRPQYSKQNMKF